jgi:diacylglycerol kinase family enzyme
VLAALFRRNKPRDPDAANDPLDYTHHPKIRSYKARRVQVLTSARHPWPIHADAIPRGHTPAVVAVVPKTLRVITGET